MMSKKRKIMIGVIVVVGILIGSIVMWNMIEDDSEPCPEAWANITLTLSHPPKVNETVNLTLTIPATGSLSAPYGLRAVIWLPKGFIWVDGNNTWAGNITGGQDVVFGGKIKAVETGNWTIGAIFYPQMIENLTLSPTLEDYASGSSDGFRGEFFSFENISYVHSFFSKRTYMLSSIREDSAKIIDIISVPTFEEKKT